MISVIIPAFNAEDVIAACLNALQHQTIDRFKYEIIVVDDGSKDKTAEVVIAFKNLKLIRQENQGPASARNNGAKHAIGDIILFTDADCVPKKNWLEKMVLPFKNDPEIVAARGIYKTKQQELSSRFVQVEYEDKYDMLSKYKYIDFVDTYSAAFKKEIFLEFGGYDTSFPVACAEDVELSFRMASKGYKIVYNPDAIVYHTHPKSFLDYFKKKYKFAYWRILAVKKNPNKLIKDSHTPLTMKLQILFFPLLFFSSFLMLFSVKGFLLSFIVLSVFLASAVPFLFKALKRDPAIGLLSPVILMGRSIAQFFGVLNGTIDHIVLRN